MTSSKVRIPNGIKIIRLEDKWETEIRRLKYRGAVIDLTTWRSLGYRTPRKSCEVRFPDGTRKNIGVESYDPRSLSRYKTNAAIFTDAKSEVREFIARQSGASGSASTQESSLGRLDGVAAVGTRNGMSPACDGCSGSGEAGERVELFDKLPPCPHCLGSGRLNEDGSPAVVTRAEEKKEDESVGTWCPPPDDVKKKLEEIRSRR